MNPSSLQDLSQMLSKAFDNTTFSSSEVGASLKKVSEVMRVFNKDANEARDNYAEMAKMAADIPMPCYRLDRSQYKTLNVRHEIL